MIQLAAHRSQADFDVPQTLAMGQLREGHAQPLIPTRESAQLSVRCVASHAALELVMRQELHQLGENRPTLIHNPFLSSRRSNRFARKMLQDSLDHHLTEHPGELNRTAVSQSPFCRLTIVCSFRAWWSAM